MNLPSSFLSFSLPLLPYFIVFILGMIISFCDMMSKFDPEPALGQYY